MWLRRSFSGKASSRFGARQSVSVNKMKIMVVSWILVLFMVFKIGDSKTCLLKLGMFDCGDGDCISTDLVCDKKIDCNTTNKDEVDCDDHFRRRCLVQKDDILLSTENFTNVYLGYNIISGFTQPILDWHFVDAHVRRHADCRRAETSDTVQTQLRRQLPLLPHNIANFTYKEDTLATMQFQSAIFENAFDAFVDMKKRKSIVIKPEITYEKDLQTVILPDAFKTSRLQGGDFYWFDEQQFWQANTPLIRLHLDKVIGEFRLRSIDRLELNPELVPDLSSAIKKSNQTIGGEGDLWWKFFNRYGTHFPIGGSVGGSIEVIAKRKLCAKKNTTNHVISMTDIQNCLIAKARHEAQDERSHCGKLDRKFTGQSTSDIIDWTHRKVIGGDSSLLGPSDQFPSTDQLDNWSQSIRSDPRPLSTTLAAICELIDRILPDHKENTSSDGAGVTAKAICQNSMVSYVKEKDVLHIPEPSMIPCRQDAVAVWRLIEKKFVLRGLPWCLSMTNEEGSCPAPAALPAAAYKAALKQTPATGDSDKIKPSAYVMIIIAILSHYL